MPEPTRCSWAGTEPLMVAYHDDEWGVPAHDDAELFELLTLEGAQAGLSWRTILNKREGYRNAFARFDPARVAEFTEHDVERLLGDASIVRHRGKIESTINNAQRVAHVQADVGSFDEYVWSFVDGAPIVGEWEQLGELPSSTPESTALSRDLKRRGFRFVGPTTVYAFMQGAGLADDHVVTCFRHGHGQG
jgi:DNA-3-methyladenine glycosylase I